MSRSMNNVRCQEPHGCYESYFTDCPHCNLSLCIKHLNEHHQKMTATVNQRGDDLADYCVSIEEKIEWLRKQQTIFNRFYDDEIKRFTNWRTNIEEMYQILVTTDMHPTSTRYQEIVQKYRQIKEDEDKRTFLHSLFAELASIIEEQKLEDSKNTQLKSILSGKFRINHGDVANTPNMQNQPSKSTMLAKESDSFVEAQSRTISTSFPSEPTGSIKMPQATCPLTMATAFGFQPEHHVPNMPCNYSAMNDSFTYDQCLKHLMSHHRIRQKPAELILSTILSYDGSQIDATEIDLFSQWPKNRILSRWITLHTDVCPFSRGPVYGVPLTHSTATCTGESAVRLYHHLRSVHDFRAHSARRIIEALMDEEPLSKTIFRPEEILFDNIEKKSKS